tara:strand:+ start:1265 stop:2530 length:1266 start_codon:yes stop_codon:yes gene_type:complete
MNKKKTFSIISLGCFRNTYDSENIIKSFHNQGYSYIPYETLNPNKKSCSLLAINTCGFIDDAKKESLAVIRGAIELKQKKQIEKIVVFGCLSERYKAKLISSFPQVDQWQGVQDLSPDFSKDTNLTPANVAFLKIGEGCFNKCSFCAIPLIKGKLKSRSADSILKEVRFLNNKGIKELNIIGQDITSWGKDFHKAENLTTLIKAILKESKNIPWLRLIYSYPDYFSDELIEIIADNKRICSYIDLPIQHINDRILKLMNRGFSGKKLTALITKIRKRIPKVVIRTSIIVGFPSETEKEFNQLASFLKDTAFERLGVFTYSREEQTKAYDYKDQVHPKTKQRRQRILMEAQQKITSDFNSQFIGKELDVLIEEKEDSTFIGRSQYDAPEVDGFVFLKSKGAKIGEIKKTKIIGSLGYDLIAQ